MGPTTHMTERDHKDRSDTLIKWIHELEDKFIELGFVKKPRQLAYPASRSTCRMTETWIHPDLDDVTEQIRAVFIIKELQHGKQIITDVFVQSYEELKQMLGTVQSSVKEGKDE